MENNIYYPFILNMWIMRKINEAYLDRAVAYPRISLIEKEMIMATPQMSIEH